MDEPKLLVCIMVEDMSDELLQKIKDDVAEEQQIKPGFKDADAYKGVTVSKYCNPNEYGGKYQH
jgi:hypothetical protein